ncbi:histidine phosphatase family protein [Saccharothrix longispora]|uniref:histidine phosphatase family protein n=1 Tax=Saccharothrix longispora TaxID=33920 RepID=UPI0028FD502B|nr:histidine phosphatase family protein [Saccharothrix longispora]MBY8849765.1 histidine phosphatase family protein [Saccharothrix sp. MB29]MDU0293402.1 histidine phosphatase family protein [Saccharothrix longispora]
MTLNRLVLWRHGETDYNATGRMQGHLDSVLTETGWNQARFAVPVLTGFAPELVVASDLRRAQDTATVFTRATGVALRIDERLRETNLGKWQGLTSAEVDVEWPGAMEVWRADGTFAPPEGETRVEVAERALAVVHDVDEEFSGTVMLCAHGGLISALTGRLLELPVDRWALLGGIGNCHWTVFTRRPDGDGRWRLSSYNAGSTR